MEMTRFANTANHESVLFGGCSGRDLSLLQGQTHLSPLANAVPACFTTLQLPAKIPACWDLSGKETGPEMVSQTHKASGQERNRSFNSWSFVAFRHQYEAAWPTIIQNGKRDTAQLVVFV